MNVKICSKMAVRELIKNGFPENVSVISFYTPVGSSDVARFRVDYSNVCDSVFYIGAPDIDESGFSEYGYTNDYVNLSFEIPEKQILSSAQMQMDVILSVSAISAQEEVPLAPRLFWNSLRAVATKSSQTIDIARI